MRTAFLKALVDSGVPVPAIFMTVLAEFIKAFDPERMQTCNVCGLLGIKPKGSMREVLVSGDSVRCPWCIEDGKGGQLRPLPWQGKKLSWATDGPVPFDVRYDTETVPGTTLFLQDDDLLELMDPVLLDFLKEAEVSPSQWLGCLLRNKAVARALGVSQAHESHVAVWKLSRKGEDSEAYKLTSMPPVLIAQLDVCKKGETKGERGGAVAKKAVVPKPSGGEIVLLSVDEDEERMLQFVSMLRPLATGLDMTIWTQKNVRPGEDRRRQVQKHVTEAMYLMPIVSADFLASHSMMELVRERASSDEASSSRSILPLLVKPAMVKFSVFSNMEWLNRMVTDRGSDSEVPKPLTACSNIDQALVDAVEKFGTRFE